MKCAGFNFPFARGEQKYIVVKKYYEKVPVISGTNYRVCFSVASYSDFEQFKCTDDKSDDK